MLNSKISISSFLSILTPREFRFAILVAMILLSTFNVYADVTISGTKNYDSSSMTGKITVTGSGNTLVTDQAFASSATSFVLGNGGTIQVSTSTDSLFASGTTLSSVGGGAVFNIAENQTVTVAQGITTTSGGWFSTNGKGTLRLTAYSGLACSVGEGSTVELAKSGGATTNNANIYGTLLLTVGNATDTMKGPIVLFSTGKIRNESGPTNLNGGLTVHTGSVIEATQTPSYEYGNFVLNGNLTVSGTGKATINAAVQTNGSGSSPRVFTVPNNAELYVDHLGNIENHAWAYINKKGAGTLTLRESSIGSLTITEGKVVVQEYYSNSNGGTTINGGTTLEFNNTKNMSIGNLWSKISGTGTLAKSGKDTTLTLSGANTAFTGTLLVSEGTMKLDGATKSSSISIAKGATIEFTSTTGAKIDNTNNATISGSGTFKVSGNANVYWGSAGATFALNSDAEIRVEDTADFTGGSSANENWNNNKADLYVASGAGFDGVEANIFIDALNGSGTVKSGYASFYPCITIGVANGDGEFSGVILDTSSGNIGKINKTGTGTQIFSGNNTYSNGTTVSGGVLKLTGDGTVGSGPVTLSGGTLEFAHDSDKTFNNLISGTGTLSKTGKGVLSLIGTESNPITATAFNVDAGTLRFSDDGDNQLYVNSDMTFGSGSTLRLEQDANGMDELILTAGHTLTLDTDSLIELVMGNAQPSSSYPIITNPGGFTEEQQNASYWTKHLTPGSDYYWNLSVVGNQLVAQIDPNAVPEPSTWALLILGAMGIYWFKRRK